ncbi:MAG TPA: hypothetical protein VE986_10010, partial [Hyphomicrobiales bacterium]|nr:hypothetical protein [Hyphomicrobiales bacterium]
MRRFILATCLGLALAQAASGQINFPSSKPAASIVTILTDGISEPNSLAAQALREVSVALEKESDLRVLNISGYGGPSNVRDLLLLRGADMALINSDVLSYLELAKVLPDARKRVKLIAPLASQGVFLFARRNVKSIEELKGKKIGTLANRPSRMVTAKTILGLLKINAEFEEVASKDLAKRSSEDLDAILLYESDLPAAASLGISSSTHLLLRLPASGPLAQAYVPKKFSKAALGDFSGEEAFETVQVATLLAAFDWTPRLGRYNDVVNFVQKFFAALPQLRARHPNALASKIDVKASFAGWSRFAAAEPLAAAAPALPPEKEENALLIGQSQGAPGDSQGGPGGPLRLLVVARPPLTNPQAADGGIILKLLTDALRTAGSQTTVKWVDSERAMLEGLLTAKAADVGLFWQT